ncbi:MAG: phage tail tape measure protein [Paracoccus sp. (in: a-proteobacteria)]|nr:phage tail tape measure protein [Paracoccus sp. (in: a-proteobacteria)]
MADASGFDDDFGGWDQTGGQAGRVTAEFQAELGRLRDQTIYTTREVDKLASGLSGSLSRAFQGVALDGLKLSDALKGIARSMADTAFSMAMKPVENALSGALSNGIAGMLSGAAPFAKGGAFTEGRVMPFAKGGVVGAPAYFPMRGATGLMGEAGPEAIMPLQRGPDGRLGVAAGGGGRAVNVTVNVQTPDVAGFQRSHGQIAAQISRAMARGERNG